MKGSRCSEDRIFAILNEAVHRVPTSGLSVRPIAAELGLLDETVPYR